MTFLRTASKGDKKPRKNLTLLDIFYSMNFRASTWSYKKEKRVSMLRFLGHSLSQIVGIHNAETDTVQDRSMGMDSYYMEIGNPHFRVYNGIERADVTGNEIHIILTTQARAQIRVTDVRIKVKPGIVQIVKILREDMNIELGNSVQKHQAFF